MPRRLIRLLVTFALGLPVVSLAVAVQPSAHIPRIGLLSVLSPAIGEAKAESFRQGLRELGYIEGQNILLESRWAAGHQERLAELAADLVRLGVAVIVTESTVSALAAKQATDTIPIVMTTSGNPVADGLVASLARPGGLVTGLTMFTPELSGTRLQLLKEVAPQTLLVAVLWNAANPAHAGPLAETKAAAQALGLQLQFVEVRTPSDLDLAFEAMASTRPSALLTLVDGMLLDNRARIVAFAAKSRLPAIFPDRDFAEAGGLMTYGPNLAANFRHAAAFVDKILKGTKPADLPVERPMTFELVINLKTAKSLGRWPTRLRAAPSSSRPFAQAARPSTVRSPALAVRPEVCPRQPLPVVVQLGQHSEHHCTTESAETLTWEMMGGALLHRYCLREG